MGSSYNLPSLNKLNNACVMNIISFYSLLLEKKGKKPR